MGYSGGGGGAASPKYVDVNRVVRLEIFKVIQKTSRVQRDPETVLDFIISTSWMNVEIWSVIGPTTEPRTHPRREDSSPTLVPRFRNPPLLSFPERKGLVHTVQSQVV